jgi:hypothetical protein
MVASGLTNHDRLFSIQLYRFPAIFDLEQKTR